METAIGLQLGIKVPETRELLRKARTGIRPLRPLSSRKKARMIIAISAAPIPGGTGPGLHRKGANELRGEPLYCHPRRVVHRQTIYGGVVLGFLPSPNILRRFGETPTCHRPGVYVSRSYDKDVFMYGNAYNIGRKPTIQGKTLSGVETYIMGLEEDLYGKDIQVPALKL